MTRLTRTGRSIDVPQVGHKAPIPLGARVGPLLCSSGIAGKDAATGQLAAEPEQQVVHAFANLEKLLTAGGATLADPLPQALVLTAIVIGFATTGFVIELALRSRHESGSDHVDAQPDATEPRP